GRGGRRGDAAAAVGRRAPALLEAARARYESLHISDDVFGESGPDSGGNPFYSTSAASRSSSAASSDDEHERPGPPPPPCAPDAQESEEDEAGAGWSATLRDRPPPRFEDTGGPTRKMPPGASAMDFFQLFVPDNVLKNMVVQTNMYAKKFQERFGSDGTWAEVTLPEMKAFLGYMISTSISHCESVLSIWSSGFYSNRSLALVMSQARFEQILKYFHVVAFRSSQTTHGLYKVQPFLDSLQNGFDSAFRPSQTQVLHEPLIDEDPVFIATCTERELRKRKKRKFSLWVRQCSSTGFIIQVSQGVGPGRPVEGTHSVTDELVTHPFPGPSPGAATETEAGSSSWGCWGSRHCPACTSHPVRPFWFNNNSKHCWEPGGLLELQFLFCNAGLLGAPLPSVSSEQGSPVLRANVCRLSVVTWTWFCVPLPTEIYCCGLLSSRKSDCTGLPPSMLTNPATPPARGQHRIKMKGNMSLICWYNKGHFRFLTNAYSPVQQGVIFKRKSGEIPCPLAVEAFAAHLSYICKYDDKYSKYFISHKPNKTWQQVFWFAISIAINNAYILYKLSDAYHVKRYSRAQFGERLVRELLGLEEASPAH
ncbi:piggyBac transposable element-derived protein 5, partial [Ailuropoda melanoleuca]|uniref:piggyBac transposable element-derived protein 5 n=1 Tax=Ailuropoda melanoleuca TaxID=9646 RepID=UPI0014945DC4